MTTPSAPATDWIYLVPNPDSFGPLHHKIVTALVPSRTMLGPKYLAICARRLPESQRWEVRYAKKRFWQRWPQFPVIRKAMSHLEDLRHFWFVRETQVLADSLQLESAFLGDDVRIVAFDRLSPEPWQYAQEIGRFLRRVWYLKDDELDGIDRQPDSTCVSPRGHSLKYRKIPTAEAVEHARKRLAGYQADEAARAAGKINFRGSWLTKEDYEAARDYEQRNPCRL